MAYIALNTNTPSPRVVFQTDHWPDMKEFATQESLDYDETDILVYGSGGLFRTFRNGTIATR